MKKILLLSSYFAFSAMLLSTSIIGCANTDPNAPMPSPKGTARGVGAGGPIGGTTGQAWGQTEQRQSIEAQQK